MPPAPEPRRFRDLAAASGRERDRSRAAVAILRTSAAVGRALERALADAGLTLPRFNVLMELAASPDGALAVSALTGRLVASAPSTSWLVSSMAEAGLVAKTRSGEDARVVLVSIAEEGWAALERALPLVSAAEAALLEPLGTAELRELARLLGRVAPTEG